MTDYFDDDYKDPLKLVSRLLPKEDVVSMLQQRHFMKCLYVSSSSKSDRQTLKSLFDHHLDGSASGCRYVLIEL